MNILQITFLYPKMLLVDYLMESLPLEKLELYICGLKYWRENLENTRIICDTNENLADYLQSLSRIHTGAISTELYFLIF